MPFAYYLLIVLFSLSVFAQAEASLCREPTTLKMGTVEQKSGSLGRFNLDRATAEDMNNLSPLNVELVVFKSPELLLLSLKKGRVDMARLKTAEYIFATSKEKSLEAFATLTFEQDTQASSQYSSVLIVRADAGISSVADLKGGSLALVNVNSASGYKVPRAYFPDLVGMPVDEFFSHQVLAGNHSRAVNDVLTGKVDAAFTASAALQYSVKRNGFERDAITVLWTSPTIGLAPYVYQKNLCGEKKQDIYNALVTVSNNSDSIVRKSIGYTQILSVTEDDFEKARKIFTR